LYWSHIRCAIQISQTAQMSKLDAFTGMIYDPLFIFIIFYFWCLWCDLWCVLYDVMHVFYDVICDVFYDVMHVYMMFVMCFMMWCIFLWCLWCVLWCLWYNLWCLWYHLWCDACIYDVSGASVIAASLARTALEIPLPKKKFLGVDPMAEASKITLFIATIAYKFKTGVILSSFLWWDMMCFMMCFCFYDVCLMTCDVFYDVFLFLWCVFIFMMCFMMCFDIWCVGMSTYVIRRIALRIVSRSGLKYMLPFLGILVCDVIMIHFMMFLWCIWCFLWCFYDVYDVLWCFLGAYDLECVSGP